MSIETQLRDALRSEAAAATSPETEPYARVHAAVIRHRRRRRAVGVGAAAAVTAIAIAIGVPTVTSRLGNEALPAGQHPLPAANDTAWNSVTTWPIRGALAANGPLVDAVQDKFNGRAVFVEDVDTARVALVVRDDRLLVVAGPRGAGGQALTQSTEVTAPRNREDGLLSVGAGSSLVILTTPDRTSAEVSGTPDIALDGTVTRSWAKLPLAGGIGRSARSPMTRFRLGSFAGPVKFRLLEDSQSTEPGSCVGDCNPPQAVQESDTTADIAWQLGLDPTQIKTTTVFNGEVPRDDVTTSGSTASVTPAPSLHVMHSRLPGGQVLRTAWFRSGDEQRSIDLGGPIDARRAAAVPLVINATGNDTVGPTNVRVFVASGTGLRAFSDSSSSEVIPITGRIAVLTLPVTPNDFWSTYRIEILEGGDSLGTFPVTHPLADPFEIAS